MPKPQTVTIRPLTGQSADFLERVLPAASAGNLSAVRTYLKAKPQFVLDVGPHGRTMLWEAARKGRLETVEYLLHQGAALETRGCYFRETTVELSPRSIAEIRGHQAVAGLLQRAGAQDGLEAACFRGDLDRVEDILKQQPDQARQAVSSPHTTDGSYPVHYAVAGASVKILDVLVEHGADVKPDGGRLLSWAFGLDDTAIGKRLLELGARPRDGDANEACLDGKWTAVLAGYGYTPDLDAPDRLGFPPLVEACRGNHNRPDSATLVADLLARGARVDIRDHKGKTALHRAAQAGFVETIDVLVKAGAELDAADERDETPLFDAVRAGRAASVEELLERGADARWQNRLGQTAGLLAERSNKPDAAQVRALLALRSSADCH